jgi:hypothetical protein
MPPTPVRKTEPVENLLAAVGFIAFLIALIAISITIGQSINMNRLHTEGIIVTARIADKFTRQVSSGRGTSTHHLIQVTYFDEPTTKLAEQTVVDLGFQDFKLTLPAQTEIGKFHMETIVISENRYNGYTVGEPIEVVYHPSNPDKPWAAAAVQEWTPWDGVSFAFICILVGLLFVIMAIRNGFRLRLKRYKSPPT